MSVLVTGSSGFIGHSVCRALLDRGERVIGIDLVPASGARLAGHPNLLCYEGDVADLAFVAEAIACHGVDRVIHLAARAGVRHADGEAMSYGASNLMGHLAILEACRESGARLVYASSSSIYGGMDRPSRETDPLAPRSLYAATKASAEMMSAVYCASHGVDATGLRFFSVYGPRGRPDMAPMIFADRIVRGQPIEIYGACSRDFTYIDDVVSAILCVLDQPAHGHRLLNVGAGQTVPISTLCHALQDALGRRVACEQRPARAGDAPMTWADTAALRALGWRAENQFETGMRKFAHWFMEEACLA